MKLTVIRSIDEMGELEDSWNHLLSLSASRVPFLRFEFIKTWLATCGGGEWPNVEPFILVFSQDTGAIRGIIPLFFTQSAGTGRRLLLAGSLETADYLDILANPTDLEELAEALLDVLASRTAPASSAAPASPAAPAWEGLELFNMLEETPTLPVFTKLAQERGWSLDLQELQPAPGITLPGDWETYLAQLDKKQRHELRRKVRRVEELGPEVRWYRVEDGRTLDSELDAFLRLMAYDPEKEKFLTPEMQQHMKSLARAAFAHGWLQLCFLTVGGEKAAGYLNFDFDNRIWVYNSGLNPAFRELSPGWVLLAYLLRWANQCGRVYFDFLRGQESYKYRFGAVDRKLVKLVLRAPGSSERDAPRLPQPV